MQRKHKSKQILILALSISALAACGQQPSQESANNESPAQSELTNLAEESASAEEKIEDQVDSINEPEESTEIEEEESDLSEDMTSDIDKESLFQDFESENDKVREVMMESKISIEKPDQVSSQTLSVDAVYDDNKEVLTADLVNKKSDGYLQEIYFDPDDPSRDTILERQADEEETTVTEAYDIYDFELKPDYHRLVEAILAMEDELEISEESNVYKLTLKEDAKNILDLIEYEYTIDLDSLNEDDVDREIEIHIDKNTKLLEQFSLEIKPKAEELKGTNLSALTNFSSHK